MAKSSTAQIKQDEKKILSELMKNSKENIDTIAKHCGFSRQKAWRLIKQLEESKKIWGYSAIVDETPELQKFFLFQRRTSMPHDTKDVEEIAGSQLDSLKKKFGVVVLSSYYIHGDYDWVTIFTAPDIIQAKKFSEEIMQRFPGKQTVCIGEVLFTLRENYIKNPNIQEMKTFI